jgi:hypothetical protein
VYSLTCRSLRRHLRGVIQKTAIDGVVPYNRCSWRLRQWKEIGAACEASQSEDWQQHGREVFKRVRRESPAAYLKVCAMLVPKEMKVEHSGGVKAMTDEQIEAAIEAIQGMLAARAAGEGAKVIEGTAAPVEESPPPESRKGRKVRKPRTLDVVPNDADPASA